MVCILIDQVTKLKAKNLKHQKKGPFRLTYVENRGAAMGFLKNHRKILITTTLSLLVIVSYMLYIAMCHKDPLMYQLALTLILGGGISNSMDRIFRGYVIDFFSIKVKRVPYFNIADMFVILGSITLLISGFLYDVTM